MKRWSTSVMLLGGMLCLPTTASSQTSTLGQRCDSDALPVDLAEARLEWMRRCALVMHVGNPSQATNAGMRAPDGNPMYEYTEPADSLGTNSYLGSVEGYQVNQTYLSLLYLSGATQQSPDPDRYLKWTRPPARRKQLPQYPIYGSQPDINAGVLLHPHPTLANCTLYTDSNGATPASTFYVNAYCDALPILPLSPTATLSTLSDSAGGRKYYALTVPAGATRVVFETTGSAGDVDLYVKAGASPTFSSYDCRPFLGGGNEVCTFNNPSPGTWYVMLNAWSSYSAATLTARISY